MDNPETLETLGTQDEEKQSQKKKSASQKTKKMNNTDATKTRG
jgi:hypothetical protein